MSSKIIFVRFTEYTENNLLFLRYKSAIMSKAYYLLQLCATRIVHCVSLTGQEKATTITVMTATPTIIKRRLVTVRDLII